MRFFLFLSTLITSSAFALCPVCDPPLTEVLPFTRCEPGGSITRSILPFDLIPTATISLDAINIPDQTPVNSSDSCDGVSIAAQSFSINQLPHTITFGGQTVTISQLPFPGHTFTFSYQIPGPAECICE